MTMAATTMKAWQYPSPGPLEKTLHLIDNALKPEAESIGENQVLIQVLAAGLNPADYKLAELGVVARAVVGFPKTAGMDLCGRIVARGGAIHDVEVGDRIIGRADPLSGPGALSEYIVLDRSYISVIASDVDVAKAAALPTAALTAYQTIAPYVQEGQGDKIFINGGSGGVGTLSIQIGKLLGCHVTVSCSTGKIDLCKDLGADEIIDYKKSSVVQELKKGGRRFQLIVDNVGNSPSDLFSASDNYLNKGCPYIFVGGKLSFSAVLNLATAALLPSFLGGVQGKFSSYMTKHTKEDLDLLAKWTSEGKLRIIIDRTFDFKEAKSAMEYVKQGSSSGKTVVNVGI